MFPYTEYDIILYFFTDFVRFFRRPNKIRKLIL